MKGIVVEIKKILDNNSITQDEKVKRLKKLAGYKGGTWTYTTSHSSCGECICGEKLPEKN